MSDAENMFQPAQPAQKGLMARLRRWFFTGLLVTAPVLLTIYITWLFVDIIDGQVEALMPSWLRDYISVNAPVIGKLPGVGLLIGVIVITVIGAVAAGFMGRWLIGLGERILNRMPVVRSIYGASKQILETVLSTQSDAFREVVMVEYPRKGLWVLGFVTGTTKGEVKDKLTEESVNVFIPTTPNPTSGFLLFCPNKDLVYLEMSVEDAVKLVVSGGIVTPPPPKTAPAKAQPKAKASAPTKAKSKAKSKVGPKAKTAKRAKTG